MRGADSEFAGEEVTLKDGTEANLKTGPVVWAYARTPVIAWSAAGLNCCDCHPSVPGPRLPGSASGQNSDRTPRRLISHSARHAAECFSLHY